MQVFARDGESFDQLLRRFTREVQGSGLLREYRQKQRFKSNAEIRHEKARAARRRARRSGAR